MSDRDSSAESIIVDPKLDPRSWKKLRKWYLSILLAMLQFNMYLPYFSLGLTLVVRALEAFLSLQFLKCKLNGVRILLSSLPESPFTLAVSPSDLPSLRPLARLSDVDQFTSSVAWCSPQLWSQLLLLRYCVIVFMSSYRTSMCSSSYGPYLV